MYRRRCCRRIEVQLIPPFKNLRDYFHDAASLQRLVDDGVVEHDHLDFKSNYNRQDPKTADEIRKDCAGLATAGEGYLLVGMGESGDGQDQARTLSGLPSDEANSLKDSISGLLQTQVDPAFGPGERLARVVPLSETHSAVVVRLRGRRGYPKAITNKHGETKFLLRVGSNTVWLSAAEARLKRQESDLERRWKVALGAFSLIMCIALAVASSLLYSQNALLAERNALSENQRNAVKVQELSAIMDGVARLQGTPDGSEAAAVTSTLIGRVVALSRTLKPYRYVDVLKDPPELTDRPLSPERGQLLSSLGMARLPQSFWLEVARLGDFSHAALAHADLQWVATLAHADLRGADMSNAILCKSLSFARMSKARLRGAIMWKADLSMADLRGADLSGASLMGAVLPAPYLLDGADMTGAVLDHAYVLSADWVAQCHARGIERSKWRVVRIEGTPKTPTVTNTSGSWWRILPAEQATDQ